MGNWDKVKGNMIPYQGTWIARNHINLLSRFLDFEIWIRKKRRGDLKEVHHNQFSLTNTL